MKFVTTTAVSAALLISAMATASAADMPARQPVYTKAPPAVAMFNWSGFYVGVHAGYAWSEADGWFAGGQLGVNWQAPGQPIVWGVEVDGAFADISDSISGPGFAVSAETDHIGSLRARVGTAADTTLFYITGGLAWAHNDVSATVLGISASDSNTHTGWTAGAGIEQALGGGWSSKIEYLYADFGSENYFGVASGDFDVHTVKLGLNYRFGAAPY